MADIAVRTLANTGRAAIRVEESIEQDTQPAGEVIEAGAPVRYDGTTGKFVNANATAAPGNDVYGIATHKAAVGEGLTAIRIGVMDGFNLDALGYSAKVYLSNTSGRVADGVGTTTVQVGKVMPVDSQLRGNAPDKLLLVEVRN